MGENERNYKAYQRGESDKKYLKEEEVRKYINKELKPTTHTWLKEVGSNVMKQAVKDASLSLQRFLKGVSGYPKFKSKHKSKPSFYVNYESLVRKQNGFQGEKIGYVRTIQALPKLKQGEKYSNPRITFDGKYWYLSLGYPVEQKPQEVTEQVVGIDLGIKKLAVCNYGKAYENINQAKRVKKIKKKLKREQRKLSRKLTRNTKGYTKQRKPIYERPLRECKNIQKQNAQIRCLHKKLAEIRKNYLHQTTTEIVKTKPCRVVMEDLNIQGMMKNKHLSKAIGEQGWYEFIRQMKYKCEWNGIEFVQADRCYPSSKTCSHCGAIKHNLKLSDRMYECSHCGMVIDRDFNAAINLANYQPA